jgi:PAS domain S-box-containing protein
MNMFDVQNQQLLIGTIFQHIPQCVFWKDPSSVYLGCNEKYAQLLGLNNSQEIIGKTDYEIGWLSDGDTADKFRAGDQETLSGKHIINQEEWLSLPNGSRILMLTNKVPLIDAQGEILGVLGVATDITEKKRTEENLAKTHYQLQGMTIVSASMSHELRTPLATIKSSIMSANQFLPALITGYEAAQHYRIAVPYIAPAHLKLLKTVLSQLDRQVDQCNRVMDMLLTNIRELSNGQVQTETCSAQKCIQKALSGYLFPANEKPTIIWNQQGEEDFAFNGKEILIIHVLFNLLKNAIYFIHKAGKGHIHIWLEHGEQVNTIHFKDTSAGIHPDDLPHIFKPFFTIGTNKGTGIGLAFCSNVIQSYGGSITCQSVYHEYSEFILTFPS